MIAGTHASASGQRRRRERERYYMPAHTFQLVSPRGTRPEPGLHSERRSQLAAGADSPTITMHRVLAGYAIALVTCSLIWYQEDEFMAAALCDVAAVFSIVCSILANVGNSSAPKKGEPNYVRWMVGVHLGMILPPAVTIVSVVAAVLGVPALSNSRRAAGVGLLLLSSAVALFYIVLLRPRKKVGNNNLV